jgi:hypothetical protein
VPRLALVRSIAGCLQPHPVEGRCHAAVPQQRSVHMVHARQQPHGGGLGQPGEPQLVLSRTQAWLDGWMDEGEDDGAEHASTPFNITASLVLLDLSPYPLPRPIACPAAAPPRPQPSPGPSMLCSSRYSCLQPGSPSISARSSPWLRLLQLRCVSALAAACSTCACVRVCRGSGAGEGQRRTRLLQTARPRHTHGHSTLLQLPALAPDS